MLMETHVSQGPALFLVPPAACGNAAGALWLEYNERIEQAATPLNLSEGWLEERLAEWCALASSADRLGWLTLARINELALLCAGRYADSGELAAAGDLLVNPRTVHVYVNGQRRPVVKRRRGRLSDQFGHLAAPDRPTAVALAEKTRVVVYRKPLLVDLHERLEKSACISAGYLQSAYEKMQAIGEAITFIAAWHLPPGTDLQLAVRSAPGADRALLEAELCRFDKRVFNAMGDDLKIFLSNPRHKSTFLR